LNDWFFYKSKIDFSATFPKLVLNDSIREKITNHIWNNAISLVDGWIRSEIYLTEDAHEYLNFLDMFLSQFNSITNIDVINFFKNDKNTINDICLNIFEFNYFNEYIKFDDHLIVNEKLEWKEDLTFVRNINIDRLDKGYWIEFWNHNITSFYQIKSIKRYDKISKYKNIYTKLLQYFLKNNLLEINQDMLNNFFKNDISFKKHTIEFLNYDINVFEFAIYLGYSKESLRDLKHNILYKTVINLFLFNLKYLIEKNNIYKNLIKFLLLEYICKKYPNVDDNIKKIFTFIYKKDYIHFNKKFLRYVDLNKNKLPINNINNLKWYYSSKDFIELENKSLQSVYNYSLNFLLQIFL